MNIKDQIRAEIERRMNELEADWSGTPAAGWAFSEVLSFLDTLPEQPVKGLEEEYKDYVENDPVYSKLVNRNAGLGIARHFAEWGMNQRPLPEDTAIFLKGVAEGKRLMMEGAVEGYVNYYEDSGGILMAEAQVGCPYHNGDKVKIIVIKEGQK